MRKINVGGQDFEKIRVNNSFYVDKTSFIKEWWENEDDVTLIARPRRFGKTLNMDMLNCFFSAKYAGRNNLFEGLHIWGEKKYRELQGTYPVIFLSFARIKRATFSSAVQAICQLLSQVCRQHAYLLKSDYLESFEKHILERYCSSITSDEAPDVLNVLSEFLYKHYGKKVLIFLDEYDSPLLEAYVKNYWDEMTEFIRSLFNSTFKSNDYLDRAILTGVTRVSKESIFSDVNNLEVITTASRKYETAFGFTEKEVFDALDEYHLSDQKDEVKKWYDGFTFGNASNIYNPWSILKFLDSKGDFQKYWANTSGNSLISYELRISGNKVKSQMEDLLNGRSIETALDEQIIYKQLETDPKAIWSLFLATGYLKFVSKSFDGDKDIYQLEITNHEVELMFRDLIQLWFAETEEQYSSFMKALVNKDASSVQSSLSYILENNVSFYDTSRRHSAEDEPEKFYHGLVLGMIVQEKNYRITSNRESGEGRYDIMMMPKEKILPGIVIEFKVFDKNKEKSLEDTADRALDQIEEKNYDAELVSNGIKKENIAHYGMGFLGKKVIVHSRSWQEYQHLSSKMNRSAKTRRI